MAERSSKIKKYYYFLGFILTLGILAYINSFTAHFQLDDHSRIVRNYVIRDFHKVFHYWYEDRALVSLSFALNFKFHGLDPFGYHIINFVIHLMSSCGVFFLMRELAILFDSKTLENPWAWAISASIFLLHPLQTMAVTYIWQRSTILATFLYIVAMIFYLIWRRKGKWAYLMAAFCFFLFSVFCKRIVITFPAALFLLEWVYYRKEAHWCIKQKNILLPIIFFILIALKIPVSMLAGNLNATHSVVSIPSMDEMYEPVGPVSRKVYSLTEASVLTTYIRLFLLPVNQTADYDYPYILSYRQKEFVLSVLLLLSLMILSILIARRYPLIAFCIAWWFLIYSIEWLPVRAVIYEHRMYLGNVPLSILFGSLLMAIPYVKIRRIILIALPLILTILTFNRNRVWADDVSMWSDIVRKAPNQALGYSNLATALAERGELLQAHKLLRKALRLNPGVPFYQSNLAVLEAQLGDVEKAKMIFAKMSPKDSDLWQVRMNWAKILEDTERFEEALQIYRDIAKEMPGLVPEASFREGLLLARSAQHEGSIDAFKRSLSIDSYYEPALERLTMLYGSISQFEDAKALLLRWVSQNPLNPIPTYRLALLALRTPDPEAVNRYKEKLRKMSAIDYIQKIEKLENAMRIDK